MATKGLKECFGCLLGGIIRVVSIRRIFGVGGGGWEGGGDEMRIAVRKEKLGEVVRHGTYLRSRVSR